METKIDKPLITKKTVSYAYNRKLLFVHTFITWAGQVQSSLSNETEIKYSTFNKDKHKMPVLKCIFN